jgi:hypothetical protein
MPLDLNSMGVCALVLFSYAIAAVAKMQQQNIIRLSKS